MRRHCAFLSQAAFTLIEMLIVLAILGIIMGVLMPGIGAMVAQASLKSSASELLSSFQLARSEAIKRNCSVAVVPSASGWQAGWSVTTDPDVACGNPVVVLENHGVLNNVIVTPDFGAGSVKYTSTGRLKGVSTNVSLTIISVRYPDLSAHCLTTSPSGQASLKRDHDGNSSNGCN